MPTVPDIHRRGTRADQATIAAPPLTVGTLYFVTDEGVTERWDGSAWESYSGPGTGSAPTAHATTHQAGGTDLIALDTLDAPTDVTTLNASAGAHGLLRKLSGTATEYLDGSGAWTTPAGSAAITQLTGDVTAGPGSGSQAATIAAAAVTYAKIQDVTAASRLLGRGSASGSGDVEEITLGTNLSLSGTTLNATGGGGSGDVVGPSSAVANEIALFDGTTGKLIKPATVTGPAKVTSGVLSAGAIDLSGSEVTGILPSAHLPARIGAVGLIIDGGGSVITTGVKGFVEVPFACTITAVTLLSTDAAVTSGSIVVDVWKDTYANYAPTVADTITASAKPTLSSATKSRDTTLTGWTTAITAGDILGFKVDSVATLTRVALSLTVQAT